MTLRAECFWFRAAFAGPKNAARAIILDQDLKYQPVSISPEDAEFYVQEAEAGTPFNPSLAGRGGNRPGEARSEGNAGELCLSAGNGPVLRMFIRRMGSALRDSRLCISFSEPPPAFNMTSHSRILFPDKNYRF